MAIQQAFPKKVLILTSFLLSSILLTLFLGYIDEGNYSFDGLFKSENLPALVFYFLIFTALQFFIDRIVLRKFQNVNKFVFVAVSVWVLVFLLMLILWFF